MRFAQGDRRFNRRNDDTDPSSVELQERRGSNAVPVESEDVVFFSNWNTALVVQVCDGGDDDDHGC